MPGRKRPTFFARFYKNLRWICGLPGRENGGETTRGHMLSWRWVVCRVWAAFWRGCTCGVLTQGAGAEGCARQEGRNWQECKKGCGCGSPPPPTHSPTPHETRHMTSVPIDLQPCMFGVGERHLYIWFLVLVYFASERTF